LDFLGLPDATVFFFVLAIFKHPVCIYIWFCPFVK
jgi:hypothetical protein